MRVRAGDGRGLEQRSVPLQYEGRLEHGVACVDLRIQREDYGPLLVTWQRRRGCTRSEASAYV